MQNLVPFHYLVNVTYAPLPDRGDHFYQSQGDGGKMGEKFVGIEWMKHPSCQGIIEKPGEKVFLEKNFETGVSCEAAIAWGLDNGYRPSTYQEAYEYRQATPPHASGHKVVALGSFKLIDDRHFVAFADRRFMHYWEVESFDCIGFLGFPILFVRKTEGQESSVYESRWKGIESMAAGKEEASPVMAVIRADALLDHVMAELVGDGGQFKDRFDRVAMKFPKIRNVWRAHQFRTTLVHDKPYVVDPETIKMVLEDYKAALQLLKAL